jgi:hypothetical protein
MKSVWKKVVAVVMSVSMFACLAGCGSGASTIKEEKFKTTLEEIGVGSFFEPVLTMEGLSEFGSADQGESIKNLRLAGGVGYKDKMTDDIDFMEYVNHTLGQRKDAYYGCYVLSDDEAGASDLRDYYIESLQKNGWNTVDPAEYGNVKGGELLIHGTNAIYVDQITSPVKWDLPKDSDEVLYGVTIWFF